MKRLDSRLVCLCEKVEINRKRGHREKLQFDSFGLTPEHKYINWNLNGEEAEYCGFVL